MLGVKHILIEHYKSLPQKHKTVEINEIIEEADYNSDSSTPKHELRAEISNLRKDNANLHDKIDKLDKKNSKLSETVDKLSRKVASQKADMDRMSAKMREPDPIIILGTITSELDNKFKKFVYPTLRDCELKQVKDTFGYWNSKFITGELNKEKSILFDDFKKLYKIKPDIIDIYCTVKDDRNSNAHPKYKDFDINQYKKYANDTDINPDDIEKLWKCVENIIM